MKHQLKETKVTNMEERKRSITELGTIKMAHSHYLKKLVEIMPRRLFAVIEREGTCTKYWCRWKPI
jgi:hypothetical protein